MGISPGIYFIVNVGNDVALQYNAENGSLTVAKNQDTDSQKWIVTGQVVIGPVADQGLSLNPVGDKVELKDTPYNWHILEGGGACTVATEDDCLVWTLDMNEGLVLQKPDGSGNQAWVFITT